jgi:rfaE bifunctional protein kinase chain/domain
MTPERFQKLTSRYPRLRIAVLGDFCLDRYLEIDPSRGEVSIETGLPVHNVVNVRAQPGAAGTILNNLVALGVGTLFPLGFAGEDGEGFELRRALAAKSGVQLDYLLTTPLRRTFTYCKPLMLEAGKPPRELNRLDSKNWTPTPPEVDAHFANSLRALAGEIDALIVMDQVDIPETGVVTSPLLESLRRLINEQPGLLILADSRRSLRGYPPVCLKMNRTELGRLTDTQTGASLEESGRTAAALAHSTGRPVFVSLAEQGILSAAPSGEVSHVAAHPTRGDIDIVGAGDAVMANLTAALASGASPLEAIQLANAAASVVIHQLGTTGTATVKQIAGLTAISG